VSTCRTRVCIEALEAYTTVVPFHSDEGKNMVMAYPSSFKFKDKHVPAAFAPSGHIFYADRIMNVDDDVPKWSGHKEKSELMDHAPEGEHTFGKGKAHKAEQTATSG
jgi:hypothetical protein